MTEYNKLINDINNGKLSPVYLRFEYVFSKLSNCSDSLNSFIYFQIL